MPSTDNDRLFCQPVLVAALLPHYFSTLAAFVAFQCPHSGRALGQFPVRLDKMESAEITWQVENGQQLPFCCLLIVSVLSPSLALLPDFQFLSLLLFASACFCFLFCPSSFSLIGRHQLRPLLPGWHFKFIIDSLSIAHTHTETPLACAQCTTCFSRFSFLFSPDPSFSSLYSRQCLALFQLMHRTNWLMMKHDFAAAADADADASQLYFSFSTTFLCMTIEHRTLLYPHIHQTSSHCRLYFNHINSFVFAFFHSISEPSWLLPSLKFADTTKYAIYLFNIFGNLFN